VSTEQIALEGLAQSVAKDAPGSNYLVFPSSVTEDQKEAFRRRVAWLRENKETAE
jgi:hypothetical protein